MAASKFKRWLTRWPRVTLTLGLFAWGTAILVGRQVVPSFPTMSAASIGLLIYGLGLFGITLRAGARDKDSVPDSRAGQAGPGVLLLAVWFGLLTGFAEAAYMAKKYALNEWIPAGRAASLDLLWMIPVAYVGAMLLVGAMLWLIGRRWPAVSSPAAATAVFGFLGFLSLFQASSDRLATYAAVILAAGLGVQLARMARPYPGPYWRLVRRTTGWAALLAVILAISLPLTGWLGERRALAATQPADPSTPNVLLLILDTVRAQNMSLYGYDRPTTPNLDSLAASSAVFEMAVAPSSWTLPTHATVFTGRFHHDLSVDWRAPLDGEHPTLAEVLRERGYATAGFTGNFYYGGSQFGLGRGFMRYEDQPRTVRMAVHSAWLTRSLAEKVREWLGIHQEMVLKTAGQVNDRLLDWLDRTDRPFFAFVNYFDAHDPYLPPAPFNTRFADSQPHYWLKGHVASAFTDEELRGLIDAYDGSIAYVDDQLGRLLQELADRGRLENTIVVITSDHGEEFGEHGRMFHGKSLYMTLLHVPLLIHFPRAVPVTRIDGPVSLRDVPATILSLLGTELPDAPLPGSSLALFGEAEATSRTSPALAEVSKDGDMRSLVYQNQHYIQNGDGSEELYDLGSDPWEERNLVGSAAAQSWLMYFRGELARLELAPSDSASSNR